MENLTKQDFDLFKKVTEVFEQSGNSIRNTADKLNLSRTKVRKILVTEGVITSDIADRARELLNEGFSQSDAAEVLGISRATLSTYLPYENRIYNREEKTNTAKRVEKCRARQASAAARQVLKVEHDGEIKEQMNQRDDTIGRPQSRFMKLHLELSVEDECLPVLQKYGKVKKSLSRDIYAPANMTLHALHYAIQRAFGWQNSHLHYFSLPPEVFTNTAGDHFSTWKDLCGLYFRFPYSGDEELADIYWDDDYQEGQSFKNWLKKKYNPPYYYDGNWEHYRYSQQKIYDLEQKYREIPAAPDFSKMAEGKMERKMERKMVALEDASMNDLFCWFECGMDELLERLTLSEILTDAVDQLSSADPGADHTENIITLQEPRTVESLITDPIVTPLTTELCYRYDYGDDWNVKVICKKCYSYENGVFSDEPENTDAALKCCRMDEPVGLAVDGMNVMDDVGGTFGFCEFLKSVYDKDFDPDARFGLYTDRDSSLAWAEMFGWNGRKSSPRALL